MHWTLYRSRQCGCRAACGTDRAGGGALMTPMLILLFG